MSYAPSPSDLFTASKIERAETSQTQAFTPQPTASLADKKARLWLYRSHRIGPATYRKMMAQHDTASAALEALPQQAQSAGLKGYRIADERDVDREIAIARKLGARLLCLGDENYPAALAQVANAPPVIWSMGNFECLAKPTIAMVGTRNASSLGLRMARKLGKEVGEAGFTTVSGLARGIDTAVHRASLETGTIAVLAGGIDVPYPPENHDLAKEILKQGVLLSEAPMGAPPRTRDFPRRNRIISGLGLVSVVIEASLNSGSMITAKNALDQGRDVLAVPGHPLDGRASGNNALLVDGAPLVRGLDDILVQLPKAPHETKPTITNSVQTPSDTALLKDAILTLIGNTHMLENDLYAQLDAPTSAIQETLGTLEIEGKIIRDIGGSLRLNSELKP